MKWLTAAFVSLLAAAALGVPLISTAAQLAIPSHLLDQGDGVYIATLNDNTGKIHVNFTSKEVLVAKDAALVIENVTPESIVTLEEDLYCDGASKNEHDLKWANEKLGQETNGVQYPRQTWAWVHNGMETSFLCPYVGWEGDYSVISAAHNAISKGCKTEASYGWVHLHGEEGPVGYLPPDFAVGRTWRGNTFCNGNFAPPMLDQGGHSLDHRYTSLDQGNGLYIASFNDAGKINVTFTSKAVLVANALVEKSNEEAEWDFHCSGISKNAYDLNWANEQLGKNAHGVLWPANNWGWVHNEGETAFFCPYRPWDGDFTTVMVWNRNIDKGCRSKASYGHFHKEPQPGWSGSPDFSIGRTWRGSHFCTGSFTGQVDQDKFDQGDGFYNASLDNAGKVNITFTLKAVLLARDALSEVPATKIIRDLQKRDGVECVDGESKSKEDLDWANMAMAKGIEGQRLSPRSWAWIHNNKETSYLCAYRPWHGSHNTVVEYHTIISNGCQSQTKYGYNHHAARNEADINLSVGRTWRGNKFCDKHFRPPPSVKSGQYQEREIATATGSGSFGDRRDPPNGVSSPSGPNTPNTIFGRAAEKCNDGPDRYGCSRGGYCWRNCGWFAGSWCWLSNDGGDKNWKTCKDNEDCSYEKGGTCCGNINNHVCNCSC
ncbi:hypothetical protein DE146DRAFT_384798 [Phaeosphaeria sp. MPI-PUGE-AT-0046c]|nr:hypothetical protein DE146DRAFT_384798 [Phaeosphaeria sp. MPI-PUGE-AT-0046c]